MKYLLVLFSLLLLLSCAEKNTPHVAGKEKKFNIKPVFFSGGNKDSSIKRIFEEAFKSRGVTLLTRDEFIILNETEGRRVGQKVFVKGANFPDADAIAKALSREHRYVSNMLSVSLFINDTSGAIYKATWGNTPFPPDFKAPYITKAREIKLVDLPYSARQIIYSIVDSILYSDELK